MAQLNVTDVVYAGNGAVYTFSNGDSVNAAYEVVNGKLYYTGLTAQQEAAVRRFNNAADSSTNIGAKGQPIRPVYGNIYHVGTSVVSGMTQNVPQKLATLDTAGDSSGITVDTTNSKLILTPGVYKCVATLSVSTSGVTCRFAINGTTRTFNSITRDDGWGSTASGMLGVQEIINITSTSDLELWISATTGTSVTISRAMMTACKI